MLFEIKIIFLLRLPTFDCMIHANELRLGNYVLQKVETRIVVTTCTYNQFELLSKNQQKNFFPVVLNAQWLEKCGFKENKDYALLPQAREFKLTLPVIGNNNNEIAAYIKNNQECFARATVNGLPVSNNLYHLHQLQNLYAALTGQELPVTN